MNICDKAHTLLSITYNIAAANVSVTLIITFLGFKIVAPLTLWAVHANASFIGNWITEAVLITEVLDFYIEKENLTFSIGVPPG